MSNITKFAMLTCIALVLACAGIWMMGGKKLEYDIIRTANASPEQIFPFLIDVEQKKKWLPNLVEQQLVGTDEIKEEASLTSVWQIDGDRVEFDDTVIRFAQNKDLSIKSRNANMLSTSVFRLKPVGSKTEITYRRIIKFVGLGRMRSVFETDNYQQQLEQEMDQLLKLIAAEVVPSTEATEAADEETSTPAEDADGPDDSAADGDAETDDSASQ